MKIIPVKHILTAALFGYVSTISMFKVCKQYPGDNFTWDNFKKLSKDSITSNLFMNFSDNVWNMYKKELIKEAIESSDNLASLLVDLVSK